MGLFDNLPGNWLDWLDVILTLLRECQDEGDDEQAVFNRLRNPGRREFVGAVRAARRRGLRLREARQQARADMLALEKATDAEILDLIRMSKEKEPD